MRFVRYYDEFKMKYRATEVRISLSKWVSVAIVSKDGLKMKYRATEVRIISRLVRP